MTYGTTAGTVTTAGYGGYATPVTYGTAAYSSPATYSTGYVAPTYGTTGYGYGSTAYALPTQASMVMPAYGYGGYGAYDQNVAGVYGVPSLAAPKKKKSGCCKCG